MHACELSWPKTPFSNINCSNFFSFITDFKFIPAKICIHKHEIFSGLLILIIQMFSVSLLNQYFMHKYFSESSSNRSKSCFGSSFSQIFCYKLFLKFWFSHLLLLCSLIELVATCLFFNQWDDTRGGKGKKNPVNVFLVIQRKAV